VTFVAGGRAWAIDPSSPATATCLFLTSDPGPFAWGPQADRVALADLATRGFGSQAPRLAATDATPQEMDWGHPIGLAIVYTQEGDRKPSKRFMDDGRVERLNGLPAGDYLDVAYHPSGLALAFVLDQSGSQSIWISSNEGEEPLRLVFSKGGTRFTSIAFSPNGERLLWTAQHVGGFPKIHSMALADRRGFDDRWSGEQGTEAWNLQLPPQGDLMAFDDAAPCKRGHAAVVYGPKVARPALPDDDRPSTALGWLDRDTLLVAAGECGSALDLFAVDVLGGGQPALLVSGAEVAAPRVVAPVSPEEVPAPTPEEEPPPGGVGR
jgi:hypothetical protein